MATPEPPPTYEQLRAQRAAEWEAAQALARRQFTDLVDTIMRMPDVADAPPPESEWSHAQLACPVCASKYFRIRPRGWVTVNGIRHRVAVVCLGCEHHDTWDWATASWMGG